MRRVITTMAPRSSAIEVPGSIEMEDMYVRMYFHFLQQMANRRAVGALRYEKHGRPDQRKKYLSRLGLELKAYARTGNHEHLLNIANYAFLESCAPENRKYHFDATAESATRGALGGANPT